MLELHEVRRRYWLQQAHERIRHLYDKCMLIHVRASPHCIQTTLLRSPGVHVVRTTRSKGKGHITNECFRQIGESRPQELSSYTEW